MKTERAKRTRGEYAALVTKITEIVKIEGFVLLSAKCGNLHAAWHDGNDDKIFLSKIEKNNKMSTIQLERLPEDVLKIIDNDIQELAQKPLKINHPV